MQTTNIAQASSGALTAPRGLSGTALKFLALGLMVLDHIHYFFGFTGAVPLSPLSVLSRMMMVEARPSSIRALTV